VLIEVRRPYVDVSATDLSLTHGAPPAPAIEILRETIGGYALELRLLGFSHQALVDGGGALSETVACVPGATGALPQRRSDGRYDFRARVERHPRDGYAARAASVLAAAAGDPHALAGVFAAEPRAGAVDGTAMQRPAMPAFTALAARPLPSGDGIAWTTWHGYPQTGEIVVTSSSFGGAP
jgi:hypothetical protein